jgi:ATP-binding cassette subfamily B protein
LSETNPNVMSPHLTALRCAFLVAQHHGVQVPPETLLHAAEGASTHETGPAMRKLLYDAGFKSKQIRRRKWNDFFSLGSAFPVICQMKAGNWVIVAFAMQAHEGPVVAVLDPRLEHEGVKLLTRDKFEDEWAGIMVLSRRYYKVSDTSQPFGFRWFFPEIIRHSRYFRDIAICALMGNVVSFATPLFFNVMIDKVIPHHSYNTLMAVVLAFTITTAFDGVFSYLRQYITLFATNKIDASLSSRTFEKLLSLPLHFFERTSAGVLVRNMMQTESVRQFLTGRLFHTMLDVTNLPILLVGLSMYSFKLTMLVLIFSLAMAGVIAGMLPIFRNQLEKLYAAEGNRQADLVETIHGVRAIKSLALEPARLAAWNEKTATAIRSRFTVGSIGAIGSVVTNVIEKMMQIAIIGVGASDVFDGTLSLGALVAFNMMAGRVTGPLVQVVGLINEYQQTALSVRMLGGVMNHPPEREAGHRGIRPVIDGRMEFDAVTFTYEGGSNPALDRVSFNVEEGQVIGIVGRSGSGKTTVTRLIQGIHTAQNGMIKLSGTDIRHIDLPHLRKSIGVVLQDNILFRGTIIDNIAAGRPDANLSEVVEAARMAGADEFIDRLPRSYETWVEENATNFSGGQKQRIAIARALLIKPRLLIFDEATSALDPESEAIIQNNLDMIAQGRTMIIVSHRLSSLTLADRILVLDKGQVADFAPHDELVERCEVYRNLWHQQTKHVH